MTSNFDQFSQQLKKKGEEKFIAKARELYKSLVRVTFSYVSANSLQTGLAYGSPVRTGRFYSSHTLNINSIDKNVKPVNPDGEKKPYPGIELSSIEPKISQLKLEDTVYIANSLPYARFLEEGGSKFKAPNGIYRVAAELVKVKFSNVSVQLNNRPGA